MTVFEHHPIIASASVRAPGGQPAPGAERAPTQTPTTDAGRIVSLNVSDGGVPKRPLTAADVTHAGVAGDRQRDRRHHGGPDRALCLWSAERIAALQGEGHPVVPGTAGENVTIAGIDWARVVPGVRLRLGPVLAEVTAYAAPCRTIARSFYDGRSGRIAQKTHPGWSRVYARVLAAGRLTVGDEVVVEG